MSENALAAHDGRDPPAETRRPGQTMFGATERELSSSWRGRLRDVAAARSRLELLAALHTGPRLLKFQHFYRIYHAHFRRLRGRPLSMMEIGVGYGGSLRLWRRYFGPRARIVGVDFRPECRHHARGNVHIEIGDQGDPDFMNEIARRHGPFDLVIDDGSHAYDHQLNTFRTLFPHIKDGGVYACEDICTSYWSEMFGGGRGAPGSYVEFLKSLIDEQNAWFWKDGFAAESGALGHDLQGLHFYPALVVIDKRRQSHPQVTHVGSLG